MAIVYTVEDNLIFSTMNIFALPSLPHSLFLYRVNLIHCSFPRAHPSLTLWLFNQSEMIYFSLCLQTTKALFIINTKQVGNWTRLYLPKMNWLVHVESIDLVLGLVEGLLPVSYLTCTVVTVQTREANWLSSPLISCYRVCSVEERGLHSDTRFQC